MSGAEHHHDEHGEKKGLGSQFFDETIVGWSMFYTIVVLTIIFMILIGLVS